MEYVELGDRWLHFGAGVLWIGLLYFFNWVNAAFAPTMDAETKRKVVPELMPRALYWFRWGAAFTWITGVILLFVVYYHGYGGGYMIEAEHRDGPIGAMDWLPAFGGLIVGFFVYDNLFKAMAKQHSAAVVVWGLVTVAFAWLLHDVLHYSDRAVYIHVAGLFGTAMAANVWMRIGPAQRRIITAIKNGEAPVPADPAMAGLRSKHNTYMSVSLLLFMVGSDDKLNRLPYNNYLVIIAVVLVLSWVVTYLIYGKAKKVPGF